MIGQVLQEVAASRRAAERNNADLQRLTASFYATTVYYRPRQESETRARRDVPQ